MRINIYSVMIPLQILSYFLGLQLSHAFSLNIEPEEFVKNTVSNRLNSPTIYRPLTDKLRHPNNTILRLWYFPSMIIQKNNRQVYVEIEDGNNAWFEGIVYSGNNEILYQYGHRSNNSNALLMLIETIENSNLFDEPSIDDSLDTIGGVTEILEIFHEGRYHYTARKEYQNTILENLTKFLLVSVFEDMKPPSMPEFFFSDNYSMISHSNDSSVVKLSSIDWKNSDNVIESLGFPHEVRSRPSSRLWTYFLADRSVLIILFDAQMKIVSLRLDFWIFENFNDVSIIWKRQRHQVYPIDHIDIWKWMDEYDEPAFDNP